MNRLAPENMETGRIGGDEFMALFAGGQGKEIIKTMRDNCLKALLRFYGQKKNCR